MKTGNVTGIVYERSIHKKLNIENQKDGNGAARGEYCAIFSILQNDGLTGALSETADALPGTADALPGTADALSGTWNAVAGTSNAAVLEMACAQTQTVYSQPGCGRYAVYAAVNQAAAAGVLTVSGILLRILWPHKLPEPELGKLAAEAQDTARRLGTVIADVKVSVSDAVLRPMVMAAAVGTVDWNGKQQKGCAPSALAQTGRHTAIQTGRHTAAQTGRRAARIPAGSQVVMTKWAGLEGSAMLAQQCSARLAERYPSYLLEEAAGFEQYFSILPEAAVAAQSGVSVTCAAAEGGIFRALWTLAERAGTGLEIDLKKIPIRQETVEICNHLDLNPYELLANGSLLCVTEHGEALAAELEKAGIPAAVIGVVTDNNDRVIGNGEERRFLEPAKEDEIYKIW